MSASIKAALLIAGLALVATAARSDGIGSFANGRGVFGGIGGLASGSVTPPPIGGALLLEDGSSILLLEDGTSHLCLEGGC